MQSEQILFTSTTLDALLEGVRSIVQQEIKATQKQDLESKEWLTAKEVQSLLKISPVTLYNYDKSGRTKPHKVGRRRRYRKDQILDVIRAIEQRKS